MIERRGRALCVTKTSKILLVPWLIRGGSPLWPCAETAAARLTLRGADSLVLASIVVNIAALKTAVDDLAAGNDT